MKKQSNTKYRAVCSEKQKVFMAKPFVVKETKEPK